VAERVERGDVRLVRFPQPDKARPVLIMTRSSAIRYLGRITVAPITSTIRGVPSEVRLDEADGMKSPCVVNLHNLVTVQKESIGARLTRLGTSRMDEVCKATAFTLGCDEPMASD
jgi:mRNA interferase MazF